MNPPSTPNLKVCVVQKGHKTPKNWVRCVLDEHIKFDTRALESYCFEDWSPIHFDLLIIAAAVEFCDKKRARSSTFWPRFFKLRIPVHEPDHWSSIPVHAALISALGYLTGDHWSIEFSRLAEPIKAPKEAPLPFPCQDQQVMAFSNGMDSRAVAHLHRENLVRVRVGYKGKGRLIKAPFAAVPFKVTVVDGREASARSRAFKFASIAGLATFMTKGQKVIVPESGQGALGPSILAMRSIYADNRNHPEFYRRMSAYLKASLGYDIHFAQPRLWSTKGETVQAYLDERGSEDDLLKTVSCWQKRRNVNVGGKRRQCGVCAACMLRRQSLHAAGLEEPAETYSWADLNRATLLDARPERLHGETTSSMHHYAVAGIKHLVGLSHLGREKAQTSELRSKSLQIAKSIDASHADTHKKLVELLERHGDELEHFLSSLRKDSFIRAWSGSIST